MQSKQKYPNRIDELKQIKSQREGRKITLKEIAGQTGISEPHLKALKSGRKNLNVRHLKAFGDYFEVPPAEVLQAPDSSNHSVKTAAKLPIIGCVSENGVVRLYLNKINDSLASEEDMSEAALTLPPHLSALAPNGEVATDISPDYRGPQFQRFVVIYGKEYPGLLPEYLNEACLVATDLKPESDMLLGIVISGSKSGHYDLLDIQTEEPLHKDIEIHRSRLMLAIVRKPSA